MTGWPILRRAGPPRLYRGKREEQSRENLEQWLKSTFEVRIHFRNWASSEIAGQDLFDSCAESKQACQFLAVERTSAYRTWSLCHKVDCQQRSPQTPSLFIGFFPLCPWFHQNELISKMTAPWSYRTSYFIPGSAFARYYLKNKKELNPYSPLLVST